MKTKTAIQFNGYNDKECLEFCLNLRDPEDIKANLILFTKNGDILINKNDWIVNNGDNTYSRIKL
jgi:hypothetical protein